MPEVLGAKAVEALCQTIPTVSRVAAFYGFDCRPSGLYCAVASPTQFAGQRIEGRSTVRRRDYERGANPVTDCVSAKSSHRASR